MSPPAPQVLPHFLKSQISPNCPAPGPPVPVAAPSQPSSPSPDQLPVTCPSPAAVPSQLPCEAQLPVAPGTWPVQTGEWGVRGLYLPGPTARVGLPAELPPPPMAEPGSLLLQGRWLLGANRGHPPTLCSLPRYVPNSHTAPQPHSAGQKPQQWQTRPVHRASDTNTHTRGGWGLNRLCAATPEAAVTSLVSVWSLTRPRKVSLPQLLSQPGNTSAPGQSPWVGRLWLVGRCAPGSVSSEGAGDPRSRLGLTQPFRSQDFSESSSRRVPSLALGFPLVLRLRDCQ